VETKVTGYLRYEPGTEKIEMYRIDKNKKKRKVSSIERFLGKNKVSLFSNNEVFLDFFSSKNKSLTKREIGFALYVRKAEEFVGWDLYARETKKHDGWNLARELIRYFQNPGVEILSKLDLLCLVDTEEVNLKGRNPKEVIQLPPLGIKVLRSNIAGLNSHSQIDAFVKTLKSQMHKVHSLEDGKRLLEIVSLARYSHRKIPQILDAGYSIKELETYIERADQYQAINTMETIELLSDYVRMSQTLGLPFEKYPKSLKKSHDLITRDFNLHMGNNEEEIRLNIPKKYEKVSDDFLVIAPEKSIEVLKEGKVLRHCVGSYIPKIVKGNSHILFVRRAENKEKPFFTIEVDPFEKAIVQVKGAHNRPPFAEVKKFLRKWSKEKNLNMA
jgi:hypothetical protein